MEETKLDPPTQKEAEFQAPAELKPRGAEAREPEERQVEEEHRRALEEEAMEQVGQAERLEEEHDLSPKEPGREWREQHEPGEEANLLGGHAPAQVQGHMLPVHQGYVWVAGTGSMAWLVNIEKASPELIVSQTKSE